MEFFPEATDERERKGEEEKHAFADITKIAQRLAGCQLASSPMDGRFFLRLTSSTVVVPTTSSLPE